jgi:hypothetical protein
MMMPTANAAISRMGKIAEACPLPVVRCPLIPFFSIPVSLLAKLQLLLIMGN